MDISNWVLKAVKIYHLGIIVGFMADNKFDDQEQDNSTV